MSESIVLGAIGKNPNIDKVNCISEDGIREHARTYAKNLFAGNNELDAADGSGIRKYTGTRYREIALRFPET